MYYDRVYYNTPPSRKKSVIQAENDQVAGDGVEGDHQTLGATAVEAKVDEEEDEVEEGDHVEPVEEKARLEGEVVEDDHDEAAAGPEHQLPGRPACSGTQTPCRSCRPSRW